jgi:hypothetical protein
MDLVVPGTADLFANLSRGPRVRLPDMDDGLCFQSGFTRRVAVLSEMIQSLPVSQFNRKNPLTCTHR